MTRTLPSKRLFTSLLVSLLSLSQIVSAAGVLDAISGEVNKVYEEAAPSIVRIGTPDAVQPYGTGFGTGFFINSDGTILTSYSVVGESFRAYVEYKNRRYDAVVLCKDPRSGVALLRIEASQTPFLKFANSATLKPSEILVSAGFPLNMPLAPNFGSVAGFDVQYQNRFFATSHIRANITATAGQVGGPVLNSKSEVVGMIVVPIEDGKSLYALPSNAAKKIIEDMFKYGQARHGWTGVGVKEEQKPESIEGNVIVSQLYKDTPASVSGIQSGDRVLKIGDREIKKPGDVLDAAFFSKVGEKLPVIVQRGDKTLTFPIDVKERPTTSRMVEAVPTGKPIPSPDNQTLRPKNDAFKVGQEQK